MAEVLSHALWCVHCSWLEAVASGMGQSWPLHAEATMQSVTQCQHLTTSTNYSTLEGIFLERLEMGRETVSDQGEMLLFKSTLTLADQVLA